MNQETHEIPQQTAVDFKRESILPASENEKATALSAFAKKSGLVDGNNLVPKISCDTPEKITEPLLKKSLVGQLKLPENYRIVAESFYHLNSSLKLLGLRKKLATFENVSTQMEILTKRNFLYSHLAQIKYIIPESLQIDKIFIHDKRTLLMKPVLKIGLLFDIVNGHSEVSDFVALSQAFSSRLYSFFSTHSEASDVPEAILPEPFNQRSPALVPDESLEDSHDNPQPVSVEAEIFSGIVGLNPHFRRHFSQSTAVEDENEKIVTFYNNLNGLAKETESYQQEELGDHFSVCGHTISKSVVPIPQPQTSPLAKPESSSDHSFAIETPTQSIPRRLVSSCDLARKTMDAQKSTQSCQPAKRVLDFSQPEGDESAFGVSDQILHQDISQITKGLSEDVNTLGLPHEEQLCEPTSSDISSCLAEKVTLIHSIFSSVNFSTLTKEEVVHKILVNSLDVVEKSEVDQQLDLLERLVPDWICKMLVTGGDIVYNIKNVSDLDSIRMRVISIEKTSAS